MERDESFKYLGTVTDPNLSRKGQVNKVKYKYSGELGVFFIV